MSLVVRDSIHSGIDQQFPSVYREDGEFMVEFTKAYYKFVDERMDRNIPKLRDIDTTLSSFLIFFKKKYLADLPLDTVIDTRFIIKHVSDLYRRKGTQESLELLFQLFYNEQIEVFYPSSNILRPSDSVWGGDIFLEMRPVSVVDDYPIQKGDRISGDISSAVAFVDQVNFVNFSGSLIPLVYVSSTVGKFSSDDGLTVVRSGVTIIVGKLISGSISDVTVSPEFRVSGQVSGDRLKLLSTKFGVDATGYVLSISDAPTGQITFNIEDGGFGYVNPLSAYASNSIGISNQVLVVDPTSVVSIKAGDIISCDEAEVVSASGSVYASTPSPINGTGVVVAFVKHLLYIRTTDDVTRASRLNETVSSGTYIGQYVIPVELLRTIAGDATDNHGWGIILTTISNNGFANGDITNSGGLTAQDATELESYINGSQTDVNYINHIETQLLPSLGIYKQFTSFPVAPETSGGDAITDSTTTIKINDLASDTITAIADYNDTANFEIVGITEIEDVTLITDQIGDYSNIALDSTDYGMSGAGSEIITTTINDAFTPLSIQLGAIASLKITSSGTNYQNNVFIDALHANVSKFDKKDLIINFTNPNFLMQVGDIITQEREIENLVLGDGSMIDYTVKARFLKRVDNDYYFRQISFYDFDEDISILIVNNPYNIASIRYDVDSLPMGANASISGTASYEIGQIETIATINSGYRYTDGEVVSIVNIEPNSAYYNQVVASATIRTFGAGSTEGRWKTTTSFLSEASKRIHDNHYYQEYSYEVSSIIDPAKYEPLIRDTIGVAGTKIFSSPLINSSNNVSSKVDIDFQIWDGDVLDTEYTASITASMGN